MSHCFSGNMIKHGVGENRTLRHGINIGGKTIFLKWKSRRSKCKGCEKYNTEDIQERKLIVRELLVIIKDITDQIEQAYLIKY